MIAPIVAQEVEHGQGIVLLACSQLLPTFPVSAAA